MPLSPEDLARFSEHLREHLKDPQCPVCGANVWSVEGPFFMMGYVPATATTPSTLGGPGAPVMIMICGHCAHIRNFSWMVAKKLMEPSGA
jgi:hypothetical protein